MDLGRLHPSLETQVEDRVDGGVKENMENVLYASSRQLRYLVCETVASPGKESGGPFRGLARSRALAAGGGRSLSLGPGMSVPRHYQQCHYGDILYGSSHLKLHLFVFGSFCLLRSPHTFDVEYAGCLAPSVCCLV